MIGNGGDGSYGEDMSKELGLLLREQRKQEANDRERELNIYRSGSAPPTVEGSLSAVGGLFGGNGGGSSVDPVAGTEEDLRSDPAYLSYYYSNVNLNPRLPPPVMSKEDWRFTQRALGGIGDRKKVGRIGEGTAGGSSRSLFALQPGFMKEGEEVGEEESVGEWVERGGDGLIGLSGLGIGGGGGGVGKQRSFADMFQEDLVCPTPVSRHHSRPASRNAFDDGLDALGSAETKLAHLQHEIASVDALQSSGSIGGPGSHSFAAALGASLSRSTTPDPQLVARAPSPCLPPVGTRINSTDRKINNGPNMSSGMNEPTDLVAAALSGMSLSGTAMIDEKNHRQSQLHREIDDHKNFLFNLQGGQNNIKQHPHLNRSESGNLRIPKSSYSDMGKSNGGMVDPNNSSNPYMKSSSSATSPGGSPANYQNMDGINAAFTNYGLGGYSVNPNLSSMMANQIGTGNLPPLFENAAAASAMGGGFPSGSNLSSLSEYQNLNSVGNQTAASALQMPFMDPLSIQYMRTAEYAAQVAASFNDPSMDRNYMGNSYIDLIALQKAYLSSLITSQKQYGAPFLGKPGYYGNPAFGLGMSYPGSPLASPILPTSPVGSGSPIRHGERIVRYPSGMRNLAGGFMGYTDGNVDAGYASSLLEEFKSNKTRCFELSEIAGHVVEFSADQYGSRFIQQKLETATIDEKDMVFEEIMPQALSLMTDVFGNYVIQKFFEHGSAPQRRELADQLTGHVLTLSLQMYGCRVIQKAIEVVDLDQQTKMVQELDGHVMRCVRDQNGNHRVLEHCHDPMTQQIMMDEILHCVCMLAQDQYGNYVVQHVLEHGKPHERSSIIKKLAGQIVQMSQQKFASNVVEKCLTFGGPIERQVLVNEMLGTTDENEPLQAMMKDQFANYVVQKVLETCDDQQRELILSRIKVHLSALKKYTYGKHIVARVEKLVAAGERRIGLQATYAS
ncbi:hypothetical protein QJS04_geneDACA007760 [Acorus gramineus]|uniref:PUM-HD domain-containing protein n=1 Tax=Acorus gramineus TaxID=55184 RepID=A0AAV9B2I8_ACOGR|nr:hypothetical protein QJS04_geneDACA007760 [Acorus gramineus]